MRKTYRHGGNAGDVISSLATVRALGGAACYYLVPDVPAFYAGGPHPCGNVRMTVSFCESLLPLLRAQPYIQRAEIWKGEQVDVNLDDFRETGFPFSAGHICRYYQYRWPCSLDLSEPWLFVEPSSEFAGKILVNRTARYRNQRIDYTALDGKADVVFVGLPAEHGAVRRVPCVTAPDYLTLASWLAGCRGFVGGQSSCWLLAEGVKLRPRLLEVCLYAPNAGPHGHGAYEAIDQHSFDTILAGCFC